MTGNRILASVVLINIFLAGCAGKRIKIDPNNPVSKPKSDFEQSYGFFITLNEKKEGYTLEKYPDLAESIRPLSKIDTLEEFRRFEKHFWDIRDTDPSTPQNEFKELIDSRIKDIEDEIFFGDVDIAGTRFDQNGGLKGDLANVYLFYGTPHYKEKLFEGRYNVEMMVWYYFTPESKPLFRFLFYKQWGTGNYKLFRNHIGNLAWGYLFDPSFSPLKELSNRPVTFEQDLIYLWEELVMKDPTWIFRAALFEFSYFVDVKISEALQAPEPAALTAKRFKPTILGQPNIPEGTKLSESRYHSFLPAYIRTSVNLSNPLSLMITVLRKNIDWEKRENEEKPYVANFYLRISLQNKKTRELTEFTTYPKEELSQQEFDRKNETGDMVGSVVIRPLLYPHWDGEKFVSTFGEILKELEFGEYIFNIYLQHTLTKKYNAWREEMVLKQ